MTMRAPTLAAEDAFDIAGARRKLRVQVFAPVLSERTTWACRVRLGSPIDRDRNSYGEGALQALVLAVNKVAIELYASEAWREGRLGWRAEFGGYLGTPSPDMLLEVAPLRFVRGSWCGRAAICADGQ